MKIDLLIKPGGDACIESIIRLQSIKRWHMIDTIRQQSVAEHSATVAMLASYITTTAPDAYFGSAATVAMYALFHDIAEAHTGDFPGHVKKYLNGVKDLEADMMHSNFRVNVSDPVKKLVKMCDLAEAIHFIRNNSVDSAGKWATQELRIELDKFRIQVSEDWPSGVDGHVHAILKEYISW